MKYTVVTVFVMAYLLSPASPCLPTTMLFPKDLLAAGFGWNCTSYWSASQRKTKPNEPENKIIAIFIDDDISSGLTWSGSAGDIL